MNLEIKKRPNKIKQVLEDFKHKDKCVNCKKKHLVVKKDYVKGSWYAKRVPAVRYSCDNDFDPIKYKYDAKDEIPDELGYGCHWINIVNYSYVCECGTKNERTLIFADQREYY